MKSMVALFLLVSSLCFCEADTQEFYFYGTKENPRYVFGETDEAQVFEMSDYTFVFKMGDHFYQPQHLTHLKDCPACLRNKKISE